MATLRNILENKGYRFWYVSEDTTVLQALRVLQEKNIGALLVMDGDSLRGIFSERDFARAAARTGSLALSLETRVSEVMTSQVYFVKPEVSVDEVMALMTEKRIRHVPVMNKGVVSAIISIGDVVKAMVADRDSQIHGLENYIACRELQT
jgi:CBS domain-containing protein